MGRNGRARKHGKLSVVSDIPHDIPKMVFRRPNYIHSGLVKEPFR